MYKTRTIQFLFGAALCAVLVLFSGCTDPLSPNGINGTQNSAGGTGTLRISIDGQDRQERTILPDASLTYILHFSTTDTSLEVPEDVPVTGGSVTVNLPVGGPWTIRATAYSNGTEVAYGDSLPVTIAAGANPPVSIAINGVLWGYGTFNWSFTAPTGTVITGVSLLYSDLSPAYSLSGSSGSKTIDAGFYLLKIAGTSAGLSIVKVDGIYIYANTETSVDYTFTKEDFGHNSSDHILVVNNLPYSESGLVSVYDEPITKVNWQNRPEPVAVGTAADGAETAVLIIPASAGSGPFSLWVTCGSDEKYINGIDITADDINLGWEELLEQVTLVDLPGTPAAPVVTSGNAQLWVTWTAVEGADSYEIWYDTSAEGTNKIQTNVLVDGLTASITGLANGTSYYVWVKAVNEAGFGSLSAAASKETNGDLPLAPAAPTVIEGPHGTITVTWAYVSGADRYRVYLHTVNNTATAIPQGEPLYVLTKTIDALSAGTTFYVWIRTMNESGGYSAYSPAGKVTTFLAAPEGLSISSAKEQVTVNWSLLDNADGYDIYVSESGNSPDVDTIPVKSVTAGVSSATVGGLTPNRTYYTWIRAKRFNSGEPAYSEWTAYEPKRIPDNQTVMSNFYIYTSYSYRYGTLDENIWTVEVPYGNGYSISNLTPYFDVSPGAQANYSSGTSRDFTAPITYIVTAEDGETTAEYTVNVKVVTPVIVTFSVPEEESVTVGTVITGGEEQGSATYPVLSNNVWVNGNVTSTSPQYYQFPVLKGNAYSVSWNDSYDGSGKSGDVQVTAYWQDDTSTYLFTDRDSGYTVPLTFTVPRSGTIILRVNTYGNNAYYNGSFAIKYFGATLNETNIGTVYKWGSLTLNAPTSYYLGYTGYKWILDNVPLAVTESSITLEGADLDIGHHSLTLVVLKGEGETPYSKEIKFTVIP